MSECVIRKEDGSMIIVLNDGWVKLDADLRVVEQETELPFNHFYKDTSGNLCFRSLGATIDRIEGRA